MYRRNVATSSKGGCSFSPSSTMGGQGPRKLGVLGESTSPSADCPDPLKKSGVCSERGGGPWSATGGPGPLKSGVSGEDGFGSTPAATEGSRKSGVRGECGDKACPSRRLGVRGERGRKPCRSSELGQAGDSASREGGGQPGSPQSPAPATCGEQGNECRERSGECSGEAVGAECEALLALVGWAASMVAW